MYQVYEIMDDDTLEGLANRMNIDCDEICRLNGMASDEFVSGSYIVLPKVDNGFYDFYFVKTGDTLFDISNRYDIDLNTLLSINGLDDGDFIYPNQRLLVPKNGVSIYVTKDGDTLGSVFNFMDISLLDFVNSNLDLSLIPDQVVIYKRD